MLAVVTPKAIWRIIGPFRFNIYEMDCHEVHVKDVLKHLGVDILVFNEPEDETTIFIRRPHQVEVFPFSSTR